MTTTSLPMQEFEKLDRPREVRAPGVIFDSNVIDKEDDVAEARLLDLTELLVMRPEYGNVWFSLTSLYELLAPGNAAARIELLNRFRTLYSRFGDRVRFFAPLDFQSIVTEWSDDKRIVSAPVSAIDKDVVESIRVGDLVGLLKALRDHWVVQKKELRAKYEKKLADYSAKYAEREDFREWLKQQIEKYCTEDALEQCDDLVSQLLVKYAGKPREALADAKANYRSYPCTWTYALLVRLADYAATLPQAERKAKYAHFGDVLAAHPNDYLDADIVASGGWCGMFITNDKSLVDKVNFLFDANPSLIRIQAFTVLDALVAYNPPNGAVRDRSKPIP